jgi:hypothetical protein
MLHAHGELRGSGAHHADRHSEANRSEEANRSKTAPPASTVCPSMCGCKPGGLNRGPHLHSAATPPSTEVGSYFPPSPPRTAGHATHALIHRPLVFIVPPSACVRCSGLKPR